MNGYQYYCSKCNTQINGHPVRCNNCNEVLAVSGRIMYKTKTLKIEKENKSIWRYWDLLPLDSKTNIVSKNEGFSPLIKSKHYSNLCNCNVYLKDETKNPTNSFKDRGMSVAISKAKELGLSSLATVSTGNSGLSFSMYSNSLGNKNRVYIPKTTDKEKILLLNLYGADISFFSDNLSDTRTKEIELSKTVKNTFIKAHLHSYYFEGQKTIGFEIIEQLNFSVPDIVIVPTGGGTLFTSLWKGFEELYKLKLISKIPKPVCVQASGCSPVVNAFKAKSIIQEVKNPKTAVSSIRIANPALGNEVLNIIDKYDGTALSFSDEELLDNVIEIARKDGIFVEPASSTTIAGLKKLAETKFLKESDIVVCILTGHGYKSMNLLFDKAK